MATELWVAFRMPGESRVRMVRDPSTGAPLGMSAHRAARTASAFCRMGWSVGVVAATRKSEKPLSVASALCFHVQSLGD